MRVFNLDNQHITKAFISIFSFIYILEYLGIVHLDKVGLAEFYVLGDQQWFRLLTYMFAHANLMHLLLNTIAILIVGFNLEKIIGSYLFFSFFIIGGIVSGIVSLNYNDNIIAVGASGCIMTLLGILLVLSKMITVDKGLWRLYLIQVIILSILPIQNGVDYAAHIGGLCCGLFIGFLISPLLVYRQNKIYSYTEKLTTLGVITTILAILIL